jgi:hypothetical protein
MNYRKVSNIAVFCLLLSFSANAVSGASETSFIIYDATQYRGKPDLSIYGIQPLPIVYGHFLWPDRKVKNSLPEEVYLKEILNRDRYQKEVVCLDVEHWKILSNSDNQASIQKYRKLLQYVREILPDSQIGYYGIPPKRDYFSSIAHSDSMRYRAWEKLNSSLADLGRDVDLIFPSLYTFYHNPQEWMRYATNSIEASKQYGKPILPFLWPQYHESNRIRGLTYIEPDFWQIQLETVARHANGLVIWGGWDFKNKKPAIWDENAEWWQTTKAFILKRQADSIQHSSTSLPSS